MCFHGRHFRILSVSAFAVSLFPCCRFVSLSVSSSFSLYSCSACVLVSSTCRQSRLAHRSNEPHTVHSVLSRPLYPCSHRMCLIAWAVSRSSHKQHIDMANYGIGSCTQEPPGAPEKPQVSAPLRPFPLPFRIAPFLHPVLWCSHCVPTVPWLCDVSLLLPSMLMVLHSSFK